MARIVVDLSISLDGFIAGRDDGPDLPLGRGGEALFAWMNAGPERNRFDRFICPPDASRVVVEEWYANAGAGLSGRRTFDIANGWAAGHPIDAPIFVVTHEPPTRGEWSPLVRFVSDLDRAVELAQEVAGDKVISIAGASLAKQLLRAGKLDEINLSVAPVLLGGGVRLLDDIPKPMRLEQVRVIESEGVTHLRYRVLRC